MLRGPAATLEDPRGVGSAEECAQKLMAYARASAQRVFLWPLADERAQLELFRERVASLSMLRAREASGMSPEPID